jgi:hypothetical protein
MYYHFAKENGKTPDVVLCVQKAATKLSYGKIGCVAFTGCSFWLLQKGGRCG